MPDVIINGRKAHRRALSPRPLRAGADALCCTRTRCTRNMNNKIVYTLYQNFVRRASRPCESISAGRAQPGQLRPRRGELADAAAALDWLQTYNQRDSCWVAGYSFGAWIACSY